MAMTKTNSGLVEYAKAQLGLPYWYGTFGQVASESLFKSKAKQYRATGYYSKWKDYPKQYGKRVHDCVGLIKGYIWSDSPTAAPKYNSAQDKSAYGMYAAAIRKGDISSFPAKAGQLVFKSSSKSSSKKIHHVGVYIGDGYVIEAQGHEEGVVKTKFANAGWTHWAQCPYIEDDSSLGKLDKALIGEYIVSAKSVNVRKGAGVSYEVLTVSKRDAVVTCDGHYADIGNVKWLHISVQKAGKAYSGWMSSVYLKRK